MTEETKIGRVFVPYLGLREHGILFTRQHLRRLMRRGEFPRSLQLSANRVAWDLAEIEAWKAARPAACLELA